MTTHANRTVERSSHDDDSKQPNKRRKWTLAGLGTSAVTGAAVLAVAVLPHGSKHKNVEPKVSAPTTPASAPVTPGTTTPVNSASATPSAIESAPSNTDNGPAPMLANSVPELFSKHTSDVLGMFNVVYVDNNGALEMAPTVADQQKYLHEITNNPGVLADYNNILGGPDGASDNPAATINGYRFRNDPTWKPDISYTLVSGTMTGNTAVLVEREIQPSKGIDRDVEFDFSRTAADAAWRVDSDTVIPAGS